MQEAGTDYESRRTGALALWRYGHDYLKAALGLCEDLRITANESQAHYLLTAQGIEFALKSFLRAKGVAPSDLSARIGHSLLATLQEALARDLPPPPVKVLRTIQFIAPHHLHDHFQYFAAVEGDFPEFMPMLAAGTWILGQVATDVVADYFAYYADDSATAVADMLHRMRADLHATACKIPSVYIQPELPRSL
jgi:hypothetical protein